MNVELSDVPEIVPLTLTHLLGPLILHALILALASFVWLAELFFGLIHGRKNSTVAQRVPESGSYGKVKTKLPSKTPGGGIAPFPVKEMF